MRGLDDETRLRAGAEMAEHEVLSVRERRASLRRVYRRGLAISALAHVVLFFVWRVTPIPRSPFAAAGPRAGSSQAAGGGMQAINLQVASRPIVPPKVPLITLDVTDLPDINFEPEIDVASIIGEGPGVGEGPPGIEGGQGEGDGGTAMSGLNRLVPPSPRGVIFPHIDDKDLRGTKVEVWVFVDASGRVVPDSTRLNPPTSDKGVNRRLIQEAAEWVFNPAMKAGEAVASWFPYTITM